MQMSKPYDIMSRISGSVARSWTFQKCCKIDFDAQPGLSSIDFE